MRDARVWAMFRTFRAVHALHGMLARDAARWPERGDPVTGALGAQAARAQWIAHRLRATLTRIDTLRAERARVRVGA